VRPCLILSPDSNDLALLVIVPHTTAVRGNKWEFNVTLPFLKQGAFHLQQVQPISLARLERKLGLLPGTHLTSLRRKLSELLRLHD
jgi:mRNA interferase MazF